MLVAIINNSTLVSDNDIAEMVSAVTIQLDLHLLPAWNIKKGKVKFYNDISMIPGYAWVIGITDSEATKQDNINHFIYAEEILNNKGNISAILSKEVCELIVNRFANIWVDGPEVRANDGRICNEYSMEVCKPVEADTYSINIKGKDIVVSNFLFPAWFYPHALTPVNMPFDYLKKLTAPFTMTEGGSMVVRGVDLHPKETNCIFHPVVWRFRGKNVNFRRRF